MPMQPWAFLGPASSAAASVLPVGVPMYCGHGSAQRMMPAGAAMVYVPSLGTPQGPWVYPMPGRPPLLYAGVEAPGGPPPPPLPTGAPPQPLPRHWGFMPEPPMPAEQEAPMLWAQSSDQPSPPVHALSASSVASSASSPLLGKRRDRDSDEWDGASSSRGGSMALLSEAARVTMSFAAPGVSRLTAPTRVTSSESLDAADSPSRVLDCLPVPTSLPNSSFDSSTGRKAGRPQGALSRQWGVMQPLNAADAVTATRWAKTWKGFNWRHCYKNGSSLNVNQAYIVYGCQDHTGCHINMGGARRCGGKCRSHQCPVHIKLRNVDGNFYIYEEQGVEHLTESAESALSAYALHVKSEEGHRREPGHRRPALTRSLQEPALSSSASGRFSATGFPSPARVAYARGDARGHAAPGSTPTAVRLHAVELEILKFDSLATVTSANLDDENESLNDSPVIVEKVAPSMGARGGAAKLAVAFTSRRLLRVLRSAHGRGYGTPLPLAIVQSSITCPHTISILIAGIVVAAGTPDAGHRSDGSPFPKSFLPMAFCACRDTVGVADRFLRSLREIPIRAFGSRKHLDVTHCLAKDVDLLLACGRVWPKSKLLQSHDGAQAACLDWLPGTATDQDRAQLVKEVLQLHTAGSSAIFDSLASFSVEAWASRGWDDLALRFSQIYTGSAPSCAFFLAAAAAETPGLIPDLSAAEALAVEVSNSTNAPETSEQPSGQALPAFLRNHVHRVLAVAGGLVNRNSTIEYPRPLGFQGPIPVSMLEEALVAKPTVLVGSIAGGEFRELPRDARPRTGKSWSAFCAATSPPSEEEGGKRKASLGHADTSSDEGGAPSQRHREPPSTQRVNEFLLLDARRASTPAYSAALAKFKDLGLGSGDRHSDSEVESALVRAAKLTSSLHRVDVDFVEAPQSSIAPESLHYSDPERCGQLFPQGIPDTAGLSLRCSCKVFQHSGTICGCILAVLSDTRLAR